MESAKLIVSHVAGVGGVLDTRQVPRKTTDVGLRSQREWLSLQRKVMYLILGGRPAVNNPVGRESRVASFPGGSQNVLTHLSRSGFEIRVMVGAAEFPQIYHNQSEAERQRVHYASFTNSSGRMTFPEYRLDFPRIVWSCHEQ